MALNVVAHRADADAGVLCRSRITSMVASAWSRAAPDFATPAASAQSPGELFSCALPMPPWSSSNRRVPIYKHGDAVAEPDVGETEFLRLRGIGPQVREALGSIVGADGLAGM